MGALFAWPSELRSDCPGLALTFVVPATDCNLRCSFCAIRQRREADSTVLSVRDYVRFLSEVADQVPMSIAAIQGYEPLLDEAWPYTREILRSGRRCGVPTSLVTNGTLLLARSVELAQLRPSGVTVSVDSADADTHDRVRGRRGAFDATIAGIKALSSIGDFADRLTLTSVLLPRRRCALEGMPTLAAKLGVRRWVVSPVLRIGRHEVGGPIAPSREIVEDLLALEELGRQAGVAVLIDDELGRLDDRNVDFRHLTIRRFARPDGLVRLSPSGAFSTGPEILQQVGPHTPIWRPQEQSPGEFLYDVFPGWDARVAAKAA